MAVSLDKEAQIKKLQQLIKCLEYALKPLGCCNLSAQEYCEISQSLKSIKSKLHTLKESHHTCEGCL